MAQAILKERAKGPRVQRPRQRSTQRLQRAGSEWPRINLCPVLLTLRLTCLQRIDLDSWPLPFDNHIWYQPTHVHPTYVSLCSLNTHGSESGESTRHCGTNVVAAIANLHTRPAVHVCLKRRGSSLEVLKLLRQRCGSSLQSGTWGW